MLWVYDPHSGGTKIPPEIQEKLCRQISAYAHGRPWHPATQLKPRFKNQFCYIDTIEEGDNRLFPLCRIRYFNPHGVSLALFSYARERYEASVMSNGKMEGTFQEALETCAYFID